MTQTQEAAQDKSPLPPLSPLREEPTAEELEVFMEALVARTPDRDLTLGFASEILAALPLPALPEKAPCVLPADRHRELTLKLTKMQKMASWFTLDVRDAGYWRLGDVRNAAQETSAALSSLREALWRGTWQESSWTAEEQAEIDALYQTV